MTKLSKQERNYLRNPEQYSPGYQRVLKHRIDKKRKEWNNDMQFIFEHRRALAPLGQRAEVDEQIRFDKELREYNKKFRESTKSLEIQIAERKWKIDYMFYKFRSNILNLEEKIRAFDILFYSDEFIQRFKSLDFDKRRGLENFMLEQQKRLEKCSHKVSTFFKYDDKIK